MTPDEVLLIKGWDSLDDGRAPFTPHGVAAAEAILDRGWGRAPQSMAITTPKEERLLPDYTDEELIARLIQKRAKARNGRPN